jgi:AraC-like DNA-binding protein
MNDIVGLYYDKMVTNNYLCESLVDFTGSIYQMNSRYGTGTVQRLSLGDGLDVSYWHLFSTSSLNFNNLYTDQEVLEISYCLEGQMKITINDTHNEYDLTQGNVLFYYHKNFIQSFTLQAKDYLGFSIHIHHNYLKQLVAPSYIDVMSTEWRENMQNIFKSEMMFVERAPLKMEMMAKELHSTTLKDVETYFAFQAKIMDFLSCCIHFRYRTVESPLTQNDLAIVNKARQYLLEHLCQPPSIKNLARYCNTNSCKLKKDFKRAYHTTIYAYSKEKRLEKSQALLKNTDLSIANIANQIGYANPSKYASAFKVHTGMTPSEYKKIHQQVL